MFVVIAPLIRTDNSFHDSLGFVPLCVALGDEGNVIKGFPVSSVAKNKVKMYGTQAE